MRKSLPLTIALLLAACLVPPAPTAGSAAAGESRADNVALLWDEEVLHGIRTTPPGPTVAARALAVVHTAMYDAWSAYDAVAVPTRPHTAWRRPPEERTEENKARAASFAAYRAVADLFPSQAGRFTALMRQLGYEPTDASMDTQTPVGVGNAAAAAVLEFRHRDGSNQLGDLAPGRYADYTGYVPVNTPSTVVDPNRWQPLAVVDGNRVVIQSYTTPHWGLVTPFALISGSQLRPAEGPPRYPDPRYKEEADEVLVLSAALTDYHKVIAEHFADGPTSEFPPGHWALYAQFVSRRDAHTLDEDVRMFFALGNGLLDASIAAWDAKRHFDSPRPVTVIRFLYAGQQVQGWGGPGQGTVTMNGENWRPYQVPNVVTPPFPEFFSGHSVFSATGAEILKRLTGSDAFGYTTTIPAGSSPGEPGRVPATDVVLSWATFSEAADAAGMSRRYGGIHFRSGDLAGRAIGRVVGAAAWAKAQTYFDGTAQRADAVPLARSRPGTRTLPR